MSANNTQSRPALGAAWSAKRTQKAGPSKNESASRKNQEYLQACRRL